MVSKFKFGDMVSCKHYQTSGVIIGIDEASNAASIFIDGLNVPRYVHLDSLEIIKHPDTVRLDYIERVINIDGMVKREMRKGWVLVVNDDIELTTPEPLLRDAIDSAMELTSGNKP